MFWTCPRRGPSRRTSRRSSQRPAFRPGIEFLESRLAPALTVSSLTPTTTGFIIQFNRAADATVLNLYDTQGSAFGEADLTVTGNVSGLVRGSLVVHPGATGVTFVRTGGLLSAEMVTVRLRSAANGFRDTSGELLDGNADGTAGDDYVSSFTVSSSTDVVVSVPNIARGPGQPINIPADGNGIPLRMSDGAGVTSVSLTIAYDPSFMSLTGVTVPPSLPDATATLTPGAPGQMILNFTNPTPLAAGPVEFVQLTGEVPYSGLNGVARVIDLTGIQINSGAIPARDDDAVFLSAYFGDATGNSAYTSADATKILRVAVGLDSGFALFPLTDPVVFADITGNGVLNSTDANRVLQEAIGLDRPEIPPLPPPATFWISDISGDWNNPANWSTGQVPGPTTNVIIDRGLANPTISLASGGVSVRSLRSDEALAISGSGVLTITTTALIRGAITLSSSAGGGLTAGGSSAVVLISGPITSNGGNFIANGGGALVVTGTTTYAGPQSGADSTFQANGTNSRIDLSALTSLSGGSVSRRLIFNAISGGVVDLRNVSTYLGGATQFLSQGAGSSINLSALPSLFSDAGNNSRLDIRDSGTILCGVLTTLTRVDLAVTGATPNFSQFTTLTQCGLGTGVGGVLALPGLTSFTFPTNTDLIIQAAGAGSRIDLSVFTSLRGGGGSSGRLFVFALTGGVVDLRNVSTYLGGATQFLSQGAGSSINLSALPSLFSDAGNDSRLEVRDSGTILCGVLTTLTRVDLAATGATPNFSQFTTLTQCGLGTGVGGVLALPGLTSFTFPTNTDLTIQATGAGSRIDLSVFTSLRGGGGTGRLFVFAITGGVVDLRNVSTYLGGATSFLADGASSSINLSALPSLFSDAQNDSRLEVRSSGTILCGVLTTLTRVDLAATGATPNFSQFTTLTQCGLTTGANGVLALPGLTSFTFPTNTDLTIQASGAGSRIDLTSFTTLRGGGGTGRLFVNTFVGGNVDLRNVNNYLGGATAFLADGANSTINLSALPSLLSDAGNNSRIETRNNGTITLTSGTLSTTRVDVVVTSPNTLTVGTLSLGANSTLSGNGTVTGNVDSAGAVNPGGANPGRLTIAGNYTQLAGGTLNIQLGGLTVATQYDQLTVTGAATLDGTLVVTRIGVFVPTTGNSFTVLTAGSRSGTFATITPPAGIVFNPMYSATGLTLVVQPLRIDGEGGGELLPQYVLTPDALPPLVAEAIARWTAAGVGAEAIERLSQVEVRVSDLPDGFLGFASPTVILIDDDAAGWGWFIDETPWDDSEFEAEEDSPVWGHVDLLTVLAHEFGHVLGLEDLDPGVYPNALMSALLGPGMRRSPSAAELDLLFAQESSKELVRITRRPTLSGSAPAGDDRIEPITWEFLFPPDGPDDGLAAVTRRYP